MYDRACDCFGCGWLLRDLFRLCLAECSFSLPMPPFPYLFPSHTSLLIPLVVHLSYEGYIANLRHMAEVVSGAAHRGLGGPGAGTQAIHLPPSGQLTFVYVQCIQRCGYCANVGDIEDMGDMVWSGCSLWDILTPSSWTSRVFRHETLALYPCQVRAIRRCSPAVAGRCSPYSFGWRVLGRCHGGCTGCRHPSQWTRSNM